MQMSVEKESFTFGLIMFMHWLSYWWHRSILIYVLFEAAFQISEDQFPFQHNSISRRYGFIEPVPLKKYNSYRCELTAWEAVK